MARRRYVFCNTCKQLVLVAGEPQRGDKRCPHRFSREPISPTVYYVNADGKRLYPWDARDLPKKYTDQGYQRIEVPASEIRRFERDTNRQLQREASQKAEESAAMEEVMRDRRHAELRNDMSAMDDFHKEITRMAIEEESRGYGRRYDPEFRIEGWS